MGNEHSTSRPMRECVPVSLKFKRKTEWESVHAWAYPRIAYTATETNVRWRGKSPPPYRKVVLLLRLLASRSWSQVVRACWTDGNSTYMPQWKQKDLFPLTPSVTLSGYCSISQLGGVDNHLGHWLLYNEEESCQNYKENDSWVIPCLMLSCISWLLGWWDLWPICPHCHKEPPRWQGQSRQWLSWRSNLSCIKDAFGTTRVQVGNSGCCVLLQ